MGKMYRRWDKFEVQDVIARYLSGEDVQAIAEEYGRSVRSIEMMIYRQGLHRREKSSADDRAKLDCMARSVRVDGRKKEPTKNRMKWNRLSSK